MKKILTLLLLSGGVFAQSGVALKEVILTDLKIGQARAIHELVKGTATEYDPNETDLAAFEVLQSKLKSYDKTLKPNTFKVTVKVSAATISAYYRRNQQFVERKRLVEALQKFDDTEEMFAKIAAIEKAAGVLPDNSLLKN